MLPNVSYIKVDSLKDAIEHLSSEGARLHAGGTDLMGCLRENIFDVAKVVSITGLYALRGIQKTGGGGLRIGALTTITEVAENPLVQEQYPALAQAAGEVASPQLRNQGTIGGNICQKPRCWYYRGEFHCLRKGGGRCYATDGENQYHCIFGSGSKCYIVHPSDTAPALTAFGAAVHIIGRLGKRTVPVEDFFVLPDEDYRKETVLEPDEIVTHITLPPPGSGHKSLYRKVRARRSWDFALAGVALAIQFAGDRVSKARVVLSGAAPIPWRSREAEAVVTGKKLDRQTAISAANAAIENAEPLDKNGYKIPLFRGVIEETLLGIGII